MSNDRLGWYDFPVSAQVKLLKANHDREFVIVAMKPLATKSDYF